VDKAANQAIKGVGDVLVTGTGTVVIASGSTYTGPTDVRSGTLEVDNTQGSATGIASVSVRGGATLQGTGTITGHAALDSGAVLHPGTDTPGIIHTLGGLNLAPGAMLQIDLGGTTAGNGTGFHSQVQVIGGTSLSGALLDLTLSVPPTKSNEYDIVRNLDNTPVSGRFEGLEEGTMFDVNSPFGSYAFTITYFGGNDIYHDGSHNDVVLISLGIVPEPSPLALACLVLAAAGAWGWLRRRGM
jgi:autotransporter-associated beta strand protein